MQNRKLTVVIGESLEFNDDSSLIQRMEKHILSMGAQKISDDIYIISSPLESKSISEQILECWDKIN